jgi:murein DD-endopeptidase MepM/ murein hydrolase activator NlpD
VDIGAPMGEPILATNRGKVLFSGWDSGHGQMVVLDHGGGVLSRYCHASVLLVEEGDRVEEAQVLALVGNTGLSTGPHLHYELIVDGERVDPLDYLP